MMELNNLTNNTNTNIQEPLIPMSSQMTNSRISLANALDNKDYTHAFTKIINNIKLICEQIEVIRHYSFQINSKQNNTSNKSAEINTLILNTADLFSEIFSLLLDIKQFNYQSKQEKINNITQAKKFEDQCNYYKRTFEELTQKIKSHNMHSITKSKNSIKFSMSSLSFEMNTSDSNDSRDYHLLAQNGKEFIDDINVKREQNRSIDLATYQINSASKKDLVGQFLRDEKPGMNISRSRRISSIESNQRRLESKIYKAFQPPKRTYCSKRVVYLLLLIVIVFVFIASKVLQKDNDTDNGNENDHTTTQSDQMN